MTTDLALQIEELRQKMNTSAAMTHDQIYSLEAGIQAEFDGLIRHLNDVTERARVKQESFYEKLVELASVIGIVPTRSQPAAVDFDDYDPSSIAPRFAPPANGHQSLKEVVNRSYGNGMN